ncbi:hypothetical protein BJ170DRAFT_611742 [Xylariales sp. AK1849]|nr:hypothetical protein BJ170DRAFT_611742 [Xylariales sp. AK1849]
MSSTNGLSSRGELDVIVVGAGIAGLAAALALRQAGQRVTILDQSHLDHGQDGPVLRYGPNTSGLLRRWQFQCPSKTIVQVTEFAKDGSLKNEKDASGLGNLYQHPWEYYIQAQFKQALLKQTTAPDGPGHPVEMRLGSCVTNVDPDSGAVEIEGGEVLNGDVIIAADGIYSLIRKVHAGISISKVRPGKVATHFQIPISGVSGNAIVERFRTRPGRFETWIGENQQLHLYCVDGDTLLLDCAYQSEELQDIDGNGLKRQILQLFEGFPPDLISLLERIDTRKIWSWAQTEVPSIPNWTVSKLAMVGDAAHPFLANEAQGGAHALEDAAALQALLQLGVPASEVPQRLHTFQTARQERVDTILGFTRDIGKDATASKIKKFEKTGPYTYGHDAYDWASLQLKRHNLACGTTFGQAPISVSIANKSTFETASITFETSRTYLQTLLPTDKFNIVSPGNIARATLYATRLDNLRWLGGRGYNILGLYIHNVLVQGESGGEPVIGRFLPVLFESLAYATTNSGEELGLSRTFADIDIQRTADTFKVVGSWGGVTFANLELNNLLPDEGSDKPVLATGSLRKSLADIQEQGVLHYKYIPATGRPGVADAAYPTFTSDPIPQKGGIESVVQQRFVTVPGDVKVQFREKVPQELAALHGAVESLRNLEILKIIGAQVALGNGDINNVKQVRL